MRSRGQMFSYPCLITQKSGGSWLMSPLKSFRTVGDDLFAPGDFTQLLISWRNGNKSALDEMTPLLYEELRKLARHFLSNERTGHTLQPTALVHEAYLRLIDQKQVDWR